MSERLSLRPRLLSGAVSVAGLLFATGAVAQETNFSRDVSTAIDLGLEYLASQGAYDASSTCQDAAGLAALALLEKRASAAQGAPARGYAGATDTDKERLDRAIAYIATRAINNGNSFYAYRDGADLMALSVFVRTAPEAHPAYGNALEAIRRIFARVSANQGTGGTSGYWCYYNGACRDSSTTQLVMAGLAAARGVFQNPPADLATATFDPAAALLRLNELATNTRNAYAANGRPGSNGADGLHADERGHGYNAGMSNSPQQTASGLWSQLVGGADINDTSVQGYLRWLYNRYNYQSITRGQSGDWNINSYFYYLWSFSKSLTFLEEAGTPADPGRLTPDSLGTLAAGDAPAVGYRLVHLDPATAVRPGHFGDHEDGYYAAGESPRWYFDFAYTLINAQAANGYFNNPTAGDSRWGGAWEPGGRDCNSNAYAILVLERSVGGGCIDTDSDGLCDDEDNCAAIANADQADADRDGFGDVCDECDLTPAGPEPDPARPGCPIDSNDPPVARCQDVTVAADAACGAGASIDAGSSDPDGDALTTTQDPAGPYGPGTTTVTLTVSDGQASSTCQATVTVVDRAPPSITCPPPVEAIADAACGAAVELAANANDNCGAAPVSSDAPATFGLGTTTVTFTATDGADNEAQCTTDVTVVDTTAPSVACNALATITPPDAPICFPATTTDNCGAQVAITGFDCWAINGAGKRIDKTGSCVVEIHGDTICVLDVGGVGTTIDWTAAATDGAGNTAEQACTTRVVKPAGGGGGGGGCNQGVGNGPEGCDPGNSNQGNPANSNDENGGKPGSPGKKGGKK